LYSKIVDKDIFLSFIYEKKWTKIVIKLLSSRKDMMMKRGLKFL
jgi:hypothetical protein